MAAARFAYVADEGVGSVAADGGEVGPVRAMIAGIADGRSVAEVGGAEAVARLVAGQPSVALADAVVAAVRDGRGDQVALVAAAAGGERQLVDAEACAAILDGFDGHPSAGWFAPADDTELEPFTELVAGLDPAVRVPIVTDLVGHLPDALAGGLVRPLLRSDKATEWVVAAGLWWTVLCLVEGSGRGRFDAVLRGRGIVEAAGRGNDAAVVCLHFMADEALRAEVAGAYLGWLEAASIPGVGNFLWRFASAAGFNRNRALEVVELLLASDDPEVRLKGTRALAHVFSEDADALVETLFEDPDPEVARVARLVSLRFVAPDELDAGLVADALTRWSSWRDGVRNIAQSRLGDLAKTDPQTACRCLVDLLGYSTDAVRGGWSCHDVLSRLPTERRRELADALAAAAADPSLRPAAAVAARELAQDNPALAAGVLVDLLADPDDHVRQAAGAGLFLLVRSEQPDAFAQVEAASRDPSAEVRAGAARVLPSLAGRDEVFTLAGSLLADPEPQVRRACASALLMLAPELDDPDPILDLLAVGLADVDASVRAEAASSLNGATREVADHDRVLDLVRSALVDPDPDVRANASWALPGVAVRLDGNSRPRRPPRREDETQAVQAATPDQLDALVEVVQVAAVDDDESVRVHAADAAGMLLSMLPDPTPAIELFAGFLVDPGRRVRFITTEALVGLAGRDRAMTVELMDRAARRGCPVPYGIELRCALAAGERAPDPRPRMFARAADAGRVDPTGLAAVTTAWEVRHQGERYNTSPQVAEAIETVVVDVDGAILSANAIQARAHLKDLDEKSGGMLVNFGVCDPADDRLLAVVGNPDGCWFIAELSRTDGRWAVDKIDGRRGVERHTDAIAELLTEALDHLTDAP